MCGNLEKAVEEGKVVLLLLAFFNHLWRLLFCGSRVLWDMPHSCLFFILYLCCIKVLKWNVFTDASARRLVVGQGEPLCEPWVTFYSSNCKTFLCLKKKKKSHHRKVNNVLDCHGSFKCNLSCCVLSSLCWYGSGFSRQGACGHLQREKEVFQSLDYLFVWF